ncbi:MAG: GtrA family protein [Planctomycetes bacterium]|nr:GtrA family protein [Planctomycetota bacterium]
MLTQFIKFSLVGLLNTVIHYGIFYVTYTYMEVHHLLASTLGFCVAVTNSYLINKHWTFKTRGAKVHHEFAKFVIVNLITLSINLGSMALLVEQFSMDPRVAQLASIGLTLSINFLGNKFWTFRERT